ncbi:hypothetical protein VNO78_12689 [Psophocarpus tetragonolobus]|uniref:Uncharacterized protein n=1 Tax=Psophocarpus tetragonolobus TaxID=3891 RepID=A0AAN9SPB9_PSOTE
MNKDADEICEATEINVDNTMTNISIVPSENSGNAVACLNWTFNIVQEDGGVNVEGFTIRCEGEGDMENLRSRYGAWIFHESESNKACLDHDGCTDHENSVKVGTNLECQMKSHNLREKSLGGMKSICDASDLQEGSVIVMEDMNIVGTEKNTAKEAWKEFLNSEKMAEVEVKYACEKADNKQGKTVTR